MVADIDNGKLVRSVVRVPGSGWDASSGSVCLDLSNVSSMAATVQVSRTLPAVLGGGGNLRRQSEVAHHSSGTMKTGEKATNPVNRPTQPAVNPRKRPFSEVDSTSTAPANTANTGLGNSSPRGTSPPPPSKRIRIVYMTPQQVAEHSKNIIQIPTPSGPLLLLPVPPTTGLGKPAPPTMTPQMLTQVLQERNNLSKENLALRQKLSLFKQLFQDKEKLTSFVKRLGVDVISE